MRSVIICLLIAFSIQLNASHLLGGGITWEKLVNGQFVFTLTLYNECGPQVANMPFTTNITSPNGSITLTRISSLDVSPTCFGSGQISCATYGGVEKNVYKSNPVTLSGAPPAAGWDFVYNICCRSNGIVNIANPGSTTYTIKSTMFPGGKESSPYFLKEPHYIAQYNSNISVAAGSNSKEDSLYHKLISPLDANTNMPVTFLSGYSAGSPFPSTSTDTANGPVVVNGKTGIIQYDIQQAVAGSYSFGVAVEQWRNGVLLSEISRDGVLVYVTNNWNNDPSAYAWPDSAYNNNLVYTGADSYKVTASVGDTVSIYFSASDYNLNPTTFLPQTIHFNVVGSALDSPWVSTRQYNSMPSVLPVAPQMGYAKKLKNNVHFKWVIGSEHYAPNNNSHFFTMTFKDDGCPYPGVKNIGFQVVVEPSLAIGADTIYTCAGDSVQLTGYSKSGNYQWSPAAAFTDPTVANPKILPPGSGYYYLTDPTTNDMDSVYVKLTQPAMFDLDTNNHKLELTDLNGTTNRIWYYNGVPFYYPHDTLSPFGYGDYWVKSAVGACLLISDTIHIAYGSSYSVFDPGNGGYNGVNMSMPGSIGASFQINQSATLNSVTLVGVEDLYKSGTGYDLNLKIYDANQTEVFSKDITLTPPFYGPQDIEVGYSLTANADYTIAMTGDTALSFKLYENVSYPSTPHFNGITVSGSYEGAAKQFPTQPSSYLLPITLNTDAKVVGLEESMRSNISVYPNPANDVITLSGFETEGQVQLLDIQGRLLRSYQVSSESLMIKREGLSSGVYFLNITVGTKTDVKKVIFK